MPFDDSERTEQATAKRREEARSKGQVVRSRELTSAALILGAAWGLSGMGPMLLSKIEEVMVQTWASTPSAPMTEAAFHHLMRVSLIRLLLIIAPVMGLLALIGIASSIGQHGLIWTSETIDLDWSRLNPVNGFSRLFSLQSVSDLAKTLIKFIVIVYVGYLMLRQAFPSAVVAIQSEPRQILSLVGGAMVRFALWSGLVIAILGGADYAFQRWDHERKLRMTRQEVKEEFKQTEGNPLIRSRIRSLQRERARRRMMADVPKADVVVTNPTKLAVALVYRPGTMEAPKVVAKGAGLIAQKIREVAREHRVPLVENKPLAQALFKTVEIGEQIPSKLYRVVAEVLAYVYRFKRKT